MQIHNLYNPPKTEQQIQIVNTGILLLAPFCVPQFNVDEETFNRDAVRPPWIDKEVLLLIRKKNRTQRKAKLKDSVNL